MKYYHNNYHIKHIPGKYRELANLSHYLEDEHNKRLLPVERINLEQALFEQRVEKIFLQQFRKYQALEAEQIAGAKPIAVTKVTSNDRQQYFVLQFSNGAAVRCSCLLYNIAPQKHQMNFASALRPVKVPKPPGAGQLQLSFPPHPTKSTNKKVTL
jgi:hypothetical protein